MRSSARSRASTATRSAPRTSGRTSSSTCPRCFPASLVGELVADVERVRPGHPPQLHPPPQEGRQRQLLHARRAGPRHHGPLPRARLRGAPRVGDGPPAPAVPAVRSARVRALLLHGARGPHRLSLRHLLLPRRAIHRARRIDRAIVEPARLPALPERRRPRARGSRPQDRARHAGPVQRRQALALHHPARRR